jgi:hypothetical protein
MVEDGYRQWLAEAHQKSSDAYDKAVMTLAGGALGISLVFVRDYAPHPVHKWTLGISWSLLGLSLLLILVSFLASKAEIRRLIQAMDEGKEELPHGIWVTRFLNYTAGTSFIVGVGFLVSFALVNL